MPFLPPGVSLAVAHRREIDRRRLAAGLGKEQLAGMAGVNISQLRAYLNRRWSNPSVGWLQRIYRALGKVEAKTSS